MKGSRSFLWSAVVALSGVVSVVGAVTFNRASAGSDKCGSCSPWPLELVSVTVEPDEGAGVDTSVGEEWNAAGDWEEFGEESHWGGYLHVRDDGSIWVD